MATLLELWALLTDGTLAQKVSAACLVVAEQIRVEDSGTANHANRLLWAKSALQDPVKAGSDLLPALLGANSALTQAQIVGASDPAVITAVSNAVDIFATGA